MARAFRCYQNIDTKDLLLLEGMDGMGLNVGLEACRGLLRQLHLEKGKDNRDKVTGEGQPEQSHTGEN